MNIPKNGSIRYRLLSAPTLTALVCPRRFLRTDVIFVGIIAMGVTGLFLDRMIRFIGTVMVPWKEE